MKTMHATKPEPIAAYSYGDDGLQIAAGRNPQDRYCIFGLYPAGADSRSVSLTARWTAQSVGDWSANLDALQTTAKKYQEQHNRLCKLFAQLADKHGQFRDGAELIAAASSTVPGKWEDGCGECVNMMTAECIAYSPYTGDWSQGRLYWVDDGGDLYDIDLEKGSTNPADLANIE